MTPMLLTIVRVKALNMAVSESSERDVQQS